jgi:hypothetical protein
MYLPSTEVNSAPDNAPLLQPWPGLGFFKVAASRAENSHYLLPRFTHQPLFLIFFSVLNQL